MPQTATTDNASTEKQEYEARLQRCLPLLKKQFEAGKIRIAEGLKVIDNLNAIRYTPDGSVDLSTVDNLVHSMDLAVEAMHDRDEAGAIYSCHQDSGKFEITCPRQT